ncbi:MAG: DUF1877 family protein [Bacillaceae bacterium]
MNYLQIFDGTEIGDDVGYGLIRYLEAEEVKEIATALESVTVEEFISRYDVKEMNKVDIYPLKGEWSEEDKEYLVGNFESLVDFFRLTVKENEAMILMFS